MASTNDLKIFNDQGSVRGSLLCGGGLGSSNSEGGRANAA